MMNEELTKEQKDQLGTWSSQRDVLLSEISTLRNEKEIIQKSVLEVSSSYTDISNNIKISEGKLIEIDKKEGEALLKVSKDLSAVEKQKSIAENQIAPLEKTIQLLTEKKDLLTETVATLTKVSEGILTKTSKLDEDISKIVTSSTENSNEIVALMMTLKTSANQMIKINQDNVKETTSVIGELPRLFFELQREILENRRRVVKKITTAEPTIEPTITNS